MLLQDYRQRMHNAFAVGGGAPFVIYLQYGGKRCNTDLAV